MAVVTVSGNPVVGTKYTVTTASSSDWASVSNSTYFFDLTDKLVHYKDSTGAIIEIFGAGGSGVNIYNANGTLTADRTVSGDSKILTFDNVRREIHNVDPVLGDTTGFNINVNSGSLTPFPTSRIFKIVDTNTTTEKFGINVDGNVVINNAYTLPTVAPTTGQVLGYLGSGTTQWTTASGGLTYFTEAQNTTSPNATVPVDSLTAVTGTTNGDFAILPKGTGAFIVGHIPDGSITNGGKRGTGAIELMSGSMNYYAGAQGVNSVAIGTQVEAKGSNSIAIGRVLSATNSGSISIGTGSGYASSGTDSFVLNKGSASNTNAIALNGGSASGLNSLAGGGNATASGTCSFAFGGSIGELTSATALGSVAFGVFNTADATGSLATGYQCSTKGVASRISVASQDTAGPYLKGETQCSISSTGKTSTTNTAVELSTQGGTAICLTLQNNEAIRVRGSIIGKQTASTNVTCYDFDCVVVRGTTASSTILPLSNMNLVLDTITLGTIPTLTANTTLGGLSVKSGAKLTTTIKWSCRIDSTEVILA
jgi:hypothetical protein